LPWGGRNPADAARPWHAILEHRLSERTFATEARDLVSNMDRVVPGVDGKPYATPQREGPIIEPLAVQLNVYGRAALFPIQCPARQGLA